VLNRPRSPAGTKLDISQEIVENKKRELEQGKNSPKME
jgi:hypothetical protein